MIKIWRSKVSLVGLANRIGNILQVLLLQPRGVLFAPVTIVKALSTQPLDPIFSCPSGSLSSHITDLLNTRGLDDKQTGDQHHLGRLYIGDTLRRD